MEVWRDNSRDEIEGESERAGGREDERDVSEIREREMMEKMMKMQLNDVLCQNNGEMISIS